MFCSAWLFPCSWQGSWDFPYSFWGCVWRDNTLRFICWLLCGFLQTTSPGAMAPHDWESSTSTKRAGTAQNKLIWWHPNLPFMPLEDTDSFWGALLLTAVLALDFRTRLSLFQAREYFSASEVLEVREVLPSRLLRTERRLFREPLGVSGLSLTHWAGSLSAPSLCSCTWAETSISSSLGSSLKMTEASAEASAAFAVSSFDTVLLFPASFALGVGGTSSSGDAGPGCGWGTLLCSGWSALGLNRMLAEGFSAGLEALFWMCSSALLRSLRPISTTGMIPAPRWSGGNSEHLVGAAALELVSCQETVWADEKLEASLTSVLSGSTFSLFWSRWEDRLEGTSLRLLVLLLDNLTTETAR